MSAADATRRALFLIPPTGAFVREDRCQASTRGLLAHALRPPIDLAQNAAILERAGWTCAVIDAPAEELGHAATLARVVEFQPALLLAQVTVSTLADDVSFLERAREQLPQATFVARGGHFHLDPAGSLARLPVLDAVICREADSAFTAFATRGAWSGVPGVAWREGAGVGVSEAGPPVELDALPTPSRHLLRNELYQRRDTGRAQTAIYVARGCPFRCSYCLAGQEHGIRVRRRSPQSVVAEVGDCVRRFGIRDFVFLADTFTLDRKWVEALCRELIDARLDVSWVCNSRVDTLDDERAGWMRRAGCWGVSLGLESGDEDTLVQIGKKATVAEAREAVKVLRRAGIVSLGYLMIGFPWEDEARIRRSFAGFLEIDPDLMEILFPYPYPGTEIREEMLAAGVLGPSDLPPEACALPAVPAKGLSREDLLRLRRELRLRFMLRPRFALRVARRVAEPAVLANAGRLAWRACGAAASALLPKGRS